MQVLILVGAMVIVGLAIGWVAELIWKENRPIGINGDYAVSILAAVAIGLIDWYVIPAMGFSARIRNLGVAIEPALGALLVLWLIRVAKR